MIYFLEDFSQIGFGGGQRFTAEIISLLSKFFLNSTVLHMGSRDLFVKNLALMPEYSLSLTYRMISADSGLPSRFRYLFSISRLIWFNNASYFLSCTRFTTLCLIFSVALSPFSKEKNTYILFHHLHPPSHPFVRFLYAQAFKANHFISIFPSQYLLNLYKDTFFLKHRSFVSPTPDIHFPHASSKLPLKEICSNIHLFPPADLSFLYVGMVHPEKGIFQLIKYLSYVYSKCSKLSFALSIYGTGPFQMTDIICNLIPTLPFPVSYYGHVEVTSTLYSRASCLIVPSWYRPETLCFTAIEGIKYCNRNFFARCGVLKDYQKFKHVTMIDDNLQTFSDCMLSFIDTYSKDPISSESNQELENFNCDQRDTFDSFWFNLCTAS